MKLQFLGKSGLRVSELCLGCMSFGTAWGFGADEAESHRILDTFKAGGGNFLDTANMYHRGETETFMGRWLHDKRDQMVLSTKYALSMDDHDANASGAHRKNLVRSVEASLKRLQTDYIDLLWTHAWDAATPMDEHMRALDDLVRAGKILYVGVSDTPAWVVSASNMLAELRGWTPFIALQIEYSLLARDGDRDLWPMAETFGMSVCAWAPLAAGVLTGKYTREGANNDSQRAGGNEATGRTNERAMKIARTVDAVADRLGATSTQVALAWLLQKGPLSIPIVGARMVSQLQDSMGACDLVLDAEAIAALDDVSAIPLGFPHDFLAREHVRKNLEGAKVRGRLQYRTARR